MANTKFADSLSNLKSLGQSYLTLQRQLNHILTLLKTASVEMRPESFGEGSPHALALKAAQAQAQGGKLELSPGTLQTIPEAASLQAKHLSHNNKLGKGDGSLGDSDSLTGSTGTAATSISHVPTETTFGKVQHTIIGLAAGMVIPMPGSLETWAV